MGLGRAFWIAGLENKLGPTHLYCLPTYRPNGEDSCSQWHESRESMQDRRHRLTLQITAGHLALSKLATKTQSSDFTCLHIHRAVFGL